MYLKESKVQENEVSELKKNDIIESIVKLKTIDDVQALDKFKLDHFGKEVLMKMLDGKLEEHKLIREAFYDLNSLLDDYIYENNKIAEKLYNVISLHYLSDLSNYIQMFQEENNILNYFYNQDPYTKMINILDDYKLLTHQELADKLNMSKSNLSNYITKIKPYDILYTKTIVDHKKKYYFLSYKTKQFLKNNKNTFHSFTIKLEKEKINYWKAEEFVEMNYLNVMEFQEKNNNYLAKFIKSTKEVEEYGQPGSSVIIRQMERKQNKAV